MGEAKNPGPRRQASSQRVAAAALVNLREGITTATRERYVLAVQRMNGWCALHGYPGVAELAGMAPAVYNAALVAHMQQLVVDAQPPSIGSDLLAGFMHLYPGTRGTLAESWKASRVWLNAVS